MKKFLNVILYVFTILASIYLIWSFIDVNSHNLPTQDGEISKYNIFQIMVNNMNE